MARGRLVLVATAKPWHLQPAEEEIGDALIRYDNNVTLEREEVAPLLYVFSTRLSPFDAFKIVVREPPAYVERVVPAELIIGVKVEVEDKRGLRSLVEALVVLLEKRGVDSIRVEAKPRGFFLLGGDEKRWSREVGRLVSGMAGVRVLRKAPWSIKLEDTRYGVVAALMRNLWDRMRLWRYRRLGIEGEEESKR
ncbi:hypothetical protein CF15_03845 [Pyrodictium occultum]|uniref:THUMP domain-containing protein n=1 Tax=Pyrodictium occultum TaxID=2309 RepID=A0A0V8RV56_PYROC|nr:hypothetical protein [Pyrodictium occultum]KSW11935.1 hypothetical protein CF15_03845 [Pyrodictium occultum]